MGKQQFTLERKSIDDTSAEPFKIERGGGGDNKPFKIERGGENTGPSENKPTGESLYGFDKAFGEIGTDISYLEKAYDQGHLTPEAFGKTDAQSIKAWEPFNKSMESEAAIIKEYNGLAEKREKGFTTQEQIDNYTSKITEIFGTAVAKTDADGNPVLDKNNKPVMVMQGGSLTKARNNVFEEWAKIEQNYHHDPQNIVADNYGVVYNEIDKSWAIQTGKDFTKEYQGLISVNDKDLRSNDALQKALGDENNLAYNALMSIDDNRLKATNQYKTSSKEITNNFTERALSKLKSENPDERHAAHQWINDVVNAVGDKDENAKRILIDQLKGIGPNTFKYQNAMWGGNSNMILEGFNKLDDATKTMLLENAKENKYKIIDDQEYYPASSDKTSAEYKNDLLVGAELNKWDAQLDENMRRISKQAMQIALNEKKVLDRVFNDQPGMDTGITIYDQLPGIPESVKLKAYKAAFDENGRVKGDFNSWMSDMANTNYTRKSSLTGTWGGLGWGDKDTSKTESLAKWLGYDIDKNTNYDFEKMGNQQNQFLSELMLGKRMPRKAEMQKLYNNIVSSYKRQYDDLNFDNIYTENAVFGGLGNNSSNSMTTIGLDGTIDFESKALINTGTAPTNPKLLSKQRNFSKVMGIMSGGGKWSNGSDDFAVVDDYTYNMSRNEFRAASTTSAAKLDKFFAEGKDLDNLQMTYIKYTSLPGHSMYKFYNPSDKSTIYANIKDTKLKEIEEDNYTYSRTNWLQQTFNLDGNLPLTNRKDQKGDNIFTKTPELVNIGGVYNVRYSYYDGEGAEKTNNIQIGSMQNMNVETAQEMARDFLDNTQAKLIQP